MKILGSGIDYTTGEPLLPALDEQAFAQAIQAGLEANAEQVRSQARLTFRGTSFRAEQEQRPSPNLNDPKIAGWSFLLNAADPHYKDWLEVVRPLAEARGMPDPAQPLLFHGEAEDDWFDWLVQNYNELEGGKLPYYVLIVGGPDQIPFHFQSLLGSAAAVGRVDFQEPDELKAYVDKLLRIEAAEDPLVEQEAIFFAPDGGLSDATFFSRHYLAQPLAKHVKETLGVPTQTWFGEMATKPNLAEALLGSRPALVYSASHGLVAPQEDLAVQQRFNGAICCQHSGDQAIQDWCFSAEDVLADEPYLEGAVFFQFACCGYGTPAESDFNHWLGKPGLNAQADFVAALPKALLKHPRGPLAYVGHVDTAWLHGFDDPEDRYLIEAWHKRIEPFVRTVESLLALEPVGRALRSMAKRFDILNAKLTSTYSRLQKGTVVVDKKFLSSLANDFITRGDAGNYLIFGDPAIHLRLP